MPLSVVLLNREAGESAPASLARVEMEGANFDEEVGRGVRGVLAVVFCAEQPSVSPSELSVGGLVECVTGIAGGGGVLGSASKKESSKLRLCVEGPFALCLLVYGCYLCVSRGETHLRRGTSAWY